MYSITLQTSDNIITSGDKLGQIQFAASSESDGSAAILVAGSVHCQAEGSFQSASNAASIVIATAAADASAAVGRVKVTDKGHILPMTDGTYDLGDSNLKFRNSYISEGIVLSDNTPSITTNKLYQTGGSLYFNGSAVGGGGTTYTAGSGITIDASDSIHVFGGTGNFRSISMTSHTPSPNTAQLYWDGTDIRFAGTKFTQISNPNASMVNKIPYFNSTSSITWDSSLSWDATNNRLGIGTDSPQREIHIVGSDTWGRLDRNNDSYGAAFLMTRGNTSAVVQQSWLFGLPNVGGGLSTGDDHFVVVDFGTAIGGTAGDVRLLIDKTTGSVGIGETSVDAQLHVKSNSSTKIGSIVQGAASQSANLQEWQNSSSQVLSKIDFEGILTTDGVILPSDTPSVTTDKLYNTGGTLYFNGSEIGGGSSYTAGSGLLLVGTEFNVYGGSGHFVELNVDGPFTATTKSFLIDHPSKPGMKLQYGSLEGPENGVYVRGTTNLNLIELPDYWSDLVDPNSITVTLTSLHQFQPLFVKSKNNREVFVGGVLGQYDYVIWGERKDVAKLKVEWWA